MAVYSNKNGTVIKVENNLEKWLYRQPGKRMVYTDVYGDIINGVTQNKVILDIGRGLNSIETIIANNNDYYLLDFLAPGDK